MQVKVVSRETRDKLEMFFFFIFRQKSHGMAQFT
jgi:hypothetical protein